MVAPDTARRSLPTCDFEAPEPAEEHVCAKGRITGNGAEGFYGTLTPVRHSRREDAVALAFANPALASRSVSPR